MSLLAIAGSTLLLLIVLMVLRRMIARWFSPRSRGWAQMQQVSGSGALYPLENEARSDEIGSPRRSFNAVLSQLADMRGQIEAQSFALGRSRSAVAVMHNALSALRAISAI